MHRSAFPALLLGFAGAAGACAPLEAETVVLEIRAHSFGVDERCAVASNADVQLQALGPFPVSELGAERLRFDTPERTLAFPDETRGVEATASDGTRAWLGYTDRRTENGIDVSLWADGVSCELFSGSRYPAANGGQALGFSPETGAVLVAGGDSTESAAGGALVFDSDSTASHLVGSDVSFAQARAYATLTPFGSGLLLAGGENPLDPEVAPEARDTRQTAAVYDPSLGGFTGDGIALELGRTRHAAVVLAGGETLLVGGGRPRIDGTRAVVTQFELVSPATGRSTINGVVGLANGRLEPVAVRLDDDRVLVGGGYDPAGNPLATVEWFAPDASCPISPSDGACTSEPPAATPLEPRHHRAFVALPGGGALTVGGCAAAAVQTEACEAQCGAGFGCPASTLDAWWIDPNGGFTELDLEPTGPCGDFAPERVVLAPGSDGSPWLVAWDEDAAAPCRAVFRFDPWRATFVTAELELSRPPARRTPLVSLGPDAFVWLSDDDPPMLTGLRAGVRGPLSQYETSLLVALDDPLVPTHLAPDRPPEAARRPKALFTPGGRLILEPPNASGAPVVTVLVTDARYDDVSVEIDFDNDAPVLVLGLFQVGGDGSCRWPEDSEAPLVAQRRGNEVTLRDGAGRSATCRGAPSGPVAIGARAGASSTTLTSLIVRRL